MNHANLNKSWQQALRQKNDRPNRSVRIKGCHHSDHHFAAEEAPIIWRQRPAKWRRFIWKGGVFPLWASTIGLQPQEGWWALGLYHQGISSGCRFSHYGFLVTVKFGEKQNKCRYFPYSHDSWDIFPAVLYLQLQLQTTLLKVWLFVFADLRPLSAALATHRLTNAPWLHVALEPGTKTTARSKVA